MKDSQPVSPFQTGVKKRIKKRPKNFRKRVEKDEEKPKQEVKRNSVKIPFRYIFEILFYIVPLLLLAVFFAFYYLNSVTYQEIKEVEVRDLDYTVSMSAFPVVERFTNPDISAQAAIVTEVDSQTVLYSKNPDLRFSTASTAKIMTAIVGFDYYQENSVLGIYSPVIEGSRMGFVEGDQFYFRDLLYAMFLPSSNEAAYAIAENYPGGIEAFVKRMNEKAVELGLANTHFSDPAGLEDDTNYSTVMDLSRLAGVAMKNDRLAAIFGTKQMVINELGGRREFTFSNLNKLLGINGVNGIKTGTTEGAGEVLVTSKEENGHTFIIVVMKSEQRFVDTQRLLSLVSQNVRFIRPELPESFVTSNLQ
jgi:D-alanyl-D-alanine carboxypeptidase